MKERQSLRGTKVQQDICNHNLFSGVIELQENFSSYLQNLVHLINLSGIRLSDEVREAFLRVPRHKFLNSFKVFHANGKTTTVEYSREHPTTGAIKLIYSDLALGTYFVDEKALSSSSQPSLMANMLESLALSPGTRVLEIGTGTGYNAALIAEIVGDPSAVVTVDIHQPIVETARKSLDALGYRDLTVFCRDGYYGVPECGPFDRVVATAGCPDISPVWIQQLGPEGFVLLPLTYAGWTPLVKLSKADDVLRGQIIALSGFLRMQGELGLSDPWDSPKTISKTTISDMDSIPIPAELAVVHQQGGWASFPSDFFFYLSVRDHRTFFLFDPSGYGLQDEQGELVIALPKEGRVLTNGAGRLWTTFIQYLDEWTKLAKPKPFDFESIFLPRKRKKEIGDLSPLVVERRYYTEILRVKKRCDIVNFKES